MTVKPADAKEIISWAIKPMRESGLLQNDLDNMRIALARMILMLSVGGLLLLLVMILAVFG